MALTKVIGDGVGVLTTADEGSLKIQTGTTSASFLSFADGDNNRGYVKYDHNDDSLELGVAGESHFKIDSAHILTMDKQPAFLVQMSQDLTNFSTGTDHTIVFNSEVYDTNADYNTSNYTFTAPVTGKYNVSCSIYIQNLDTAATYYQLKMVSSLGTYTTILDPNFSADNLYYSWSTSPILLALDANDTVKMQIRQTGGTAQTDINDNALYTHFHGYLIC